MATSRPPKRKNVEVENSNHIKTVGGKKLVAANDSGEGLPYAPVDFPEPGDIWSWKVGSRVSLNGHFIDRYLYLPTRLKSMYNKNRRFASKRSIKEFIATSFPNQDVDELLSSFCWKIPSEKEKPTKTKTKTKGTAEFSFESFGSDEMKSDCDDAQSGLQPARCKAGNKRCNSLVANSSGELEAIICNLCCKSESFCRDCCCTICSRTINLSANGGLDYIRCEAPAGAGIVCGHIVHVNCALQTFMAGTVGGCIDLDAECLCRPCNAKTDLVPYVEKLLKASQSNSSMDDVQKSLRMCANLLYGSTRTKAINLMSFVKLTMTKIKNGMPLEEVWEVEADIPHAINVVAAGNMEVEGTGIDHHHVVVAEKKKKSGDQANEEGDIGASDKVKEDSGPE